MTDAPIVVAPADAVYRLLTDDGLLAGTSNINTDLSSGQDFFFQPVERWLEVRRILLYLRSGTIDLLGFGAAGVLAKGITVGVKDAPGGTVLVDLTNGAPVTIWGEWGIHAGVDAIAVRTQGAGNDLAFARWSLWKGLREGILVPPGGVFFLHCEDDMQGIVQFVAKIEGRLR